MTSRDLPPADFRTLDVRVYHVALRLYPRRFRAEFAPQMLRDFVDARQDASGSPRPYPLWKFRLHILADLARTVVVQWWRTGWPVIAAVSAIVTLVPAALLATTFRRMRIPEPSTTPDELLLLELIVVTMLFLVVATILITVCFGRPRRPRRRV